MSAPRAHGPRRVALPADRVSACADAFFRHAAAGEWEAMLAVAAPDAVVWQSGGRPARLLRDALPDLRRMRERLGRWEYRDTRRIVGADGFCEQHTVRFHRADGTVRDVAVCVVGYLDASARLVRLDEYLDPSEVSTWSP